MNWAGNSPTRSRRHSQLTFPSNSLVYGMCQTPPFLAVVLYDRRNHVRDTVNSVGLIPRRLPFTTSNTIVRTFRHAVSLDEHRAKFKANLWNRPNATEAKLGVEGQKPAVVEHPSRKPQAHHQPTLKAMEKKYSGLGERPTDIEEVRIHLYHPCTLRTLRTLPLTIRCGFLVVTVVRFFTFVIGR
jgi:Uncharacterized alpha/beta hydrolase domain (DUF2235)